MKKLIIPHPNPWRFPSRYPYTILEGPGTPLSKSQIKKIKSKRRNWTPTPEALYISNILKENENNVILIQLDNPLNYYDTIEDMPPPFYCTLETIKIEKVFDFDTEFDQLFIEISNPKNRNGTNIFNEYNYDYHTLLENINDNLYKLNFSVIGELLFLN